MDRELVMLIGVFATIIIGAFNLKKSKYDRYINNISAERINWINNLRNQFSLYNKNAFIHANNRDEFKEDELYGELVYLADHIELYLNPDEYVNEVFISIQHNLISYFQDDEFSYEVYRQVHDDIIYLQQVILKAEWEKLKNETKKGKEISERSKKLIFEKVAIKINKGKYYKLLTKN